MRKPPLPALYADAVKEPPDLPDAESLRKLALPLSHQEFDLVRAAMAVHKASRQPKLTWDGWRLLGAAIEISDRHVRKLAKGQTTGRTYNALMGDFLRATGLVFIAKNVRWALRQCMGRIEDIEAWRAGLLPAERGHLVNPIDIWTRFNEAEKAGGSHPARPRIGKAQRQKVTLLEYCVALEDKIAALEEQRDELQAVLAELRRDAG